jgi:hypothetical protein
MRSKKTAATDVNRLVSSASTLLTEIVDENEAFVTSIVNVEQFVQAIFDILLPDIVFAEDYSVVLRLAADNGGSTTKVIFSFLLSERCSKWLHFICEGFFTKVIFSFLLSDRCSKWLHFICEGFFTEEEIKDIGKENYVCRR